MSECLLEMLTCWVKHTNPPPTREALAQALESPPVGERTLAQQLSDKYCRGAEESISHIYPTPVSPLPGVTPTSQVQLGVCESHHFPPQVQHTQTTLQAQFFTSPFSVPAQPHSSHPPSGPGPYYHSPVASYPMSIPFIPPHTTSLAIPTIGHLYSQLPPVPPGPIPSTPVPPTSVPAQLTTPQCATSHTAQAVVTPQPPVQTSVATDLVPPFNPIDPPGTPPTLEPSTMTTPPLPTHTAASLGIADLPTLMNKTFPCRAKWCNLGIQLRVDMGTLDCLRVQFSDPGDQLREMLRAWITTSDSPTWGTLAEALKSPVIGENQLAREVQQKYCPDGHQSVQVHLRRQALEVRAQVKTLQGNFHEIADQTIDRILDKKMTVQTFRLRIITRMDVSEQVEHSDFIEHYLMKLEPGTTVEDLLCRLSLYWNFLNYNLLQHMVNIFGDEQLKRDMEDYIEGLKVFRANTKLCDFIDNWPLRGQKPPKADLQELVIKKIMDKKWEECTLEDVEKIEETLTHKFLLPDFVLHLREAEKGCVCLTWYIPAPIAKILQENFPNIEREFFKTHGFERVTIDGAECFLTPVKTFSSYLKGVYASERPFPTVELFLPADKLLPFNLAKIERKEVNVSKADQFTRASIRGDIDDIVRQKRPMNIDEVGVLPDGSLPKLVLIEGAPGVGKTTFSWDFCTKWSRGEGLQQFSLVVLLPLRDNRLKESTGLSDLFYHPNPDIQKAVLHEVENMKGKGVLIWLEAFDELDEDKRTRSSIFLDLIYGKVLPHSTIFLTSRPWANATIAEECKDRISQHFEILASMDLQIKQYMEKSKSDPNTAVKFRDYLSFNPAVKATMYTPLTADMVAKTFLFSRDTESPPPTTMTELYTTFTQTLLLKYMSSHPVHGREYRKTLTFDDLPDDIHKHFTKLCEMACDGILNGQLVFPADQVDFDTLCLMQETPQLYMGRGSPSSFHFLHLTLQEYLAAVHISQLPSREQTELIEQQLRHGHFKMVFRFLAGLTKLEKITQNIIQKLLHSHRGDISHNSSDDKMTLFHWLFECHSDVTTVKILCSDNMYVSSVNTWTPLDFYIVGYCVAHSRCNWLLHFSSGDCIDDEKVELFSKGCHTSSTTTDRGCISSVNFGVNEITPEGFLHFLNIPQHIRQGIIEFSLYGNKLDGHTCDLLAKAIPEMPILEKLNLNYNPAIGSGGAVSLIKALFTSRVKTLRLQNTGVGEEDCVCLSELSKSSHYLKHLDIGANNLSSESVEIIIGGVTYSSSLRTLDISHSQLSVAAVVKLASLLSDQSNCKLEKLYLLNCNISSGGALELATALCKNTTLRELDLRCNPIGRHLEGVAAIATLLIENKSLISLELRDCHISGQGAGELAAALNKNSTLQDLHLDHNPIGMQGASSLSDMLLHNTSLTSLWMCDDSVGEEGVHQLMNSIKHNQTLVDLWLPKKYQSETSDHRIYWR